MKRIAVLGVCLLLMLSLTIPVMAAPNVLFTANSEFEAGCTVMVDEQKTLMGVMDSGSVTADMYNAALERNVSYHWFKDDVYYSDGKSITLKETDRGSTFYCLMALYSDMDCTQQCGYLESEKFTVPVPTNPTDPTDPTDPTKPTDPTDPTDPADPGKDEGKQNTTSATDKDGSNLWWLWIVIAVVAVGGIVFFIVFGKKKKEE